MSCFGLMIGVGQPALHAESEDTTALEEQAEQTHPFTFTVYWENDSSFLKPNRATDRYYTNGLAATIAHQPDWADGFADMIPLGEVFDDTAAGYVIAHQFFTPENIKARRLIDDDRPYAGYLFGGMYLQRSNGNTFDHIQLDLGTTGPASQADHFQYSIHSTFRADEPRGWDNQLHDEFTAQLSLRRKWRHDLNTLELWDHALDQQIISQADLALGTVYRNIGLGATYRVGVHMPDDFGPGRLEDVGDATLMQSEQSGAYAFVRVSGRVVEHDLFLEGNTYKDSHSVDAEPLVGEAQAGFAVYGRFNGWDLQANYSQTFITSQFEDQDGYHSFGALMLSATHGF